MNDRSDVCIGSAQDCYFVKMSRGLNKETLADDACRALVFGSGCDRGKTKNTVRVSQSRGRNLS